METEVAQRLIMLNCQFYQTFAAPFSATRQRLQPGARQFLEQINPCADVLDLGCGNGETWRFLASAGHRGRYVGLDFSPELLDFAVDRNAEAWATFLPADFSTRDWDIQLKCQSFEAVLGFAVLHHLPGRDLRRQVLRKVRQLLTPTGRFYHSEWQFLNSPRLRQRIQPWESIGLFSHQLEVGDYLLDWRRGGRGLRYVHHFDKAELAELAEDCGFRVAGEFLSDGKGGNLALYQVWVIV